MEPRNTQDLWLFIQERVNAFMRSPQNDLGMAEPEPAFGMPLLGVAAGNDPLWGVLQGEALGPFHWTPEQAFALAWPDAPARPEELSVLAWVLPQTDATRKDNRRENFYPSERWARNRVLGEPAVNGALRRMLVDALAEQGVDAVAPTLLPQWAKHDSPSYEIASTWSERHAAHVAGLGTFGLSDGLITPVGKAVRVGSLILRGVLPVTPRPYSHHREYCLYFYDGSCGLCVKRCPAGSVRPEGRRKLLCRDHVYEKCAAWVGARWNLKGYACGLCQTAVPCERRIPPRKEAKPVA